MSLATITDHYDPLEDMEDHGKFWMPPSVRVSILDDGHHLSRMDEDTFPSPRTVRYRIIIRILAIRDTPGGVPT